MEHAGIFASKAALNCFIRCLQEQLVNAGSNVKVIEISPPPVQTDLHDYRGEEGGRAVGMSLAEFCEEAYYGLVCGDNQVAIGGNGPRNKFMKVVENRRNVIEFLAEMITSH